MKKKTAIWIKIIVLGILTLALIGILIVGILGNTFRNFPIFGSFSSYDNADLYQVGNADLSPSELSSLSIDWVSGSVKVDVYDGNVIQIREDGASDLSDSDKAHYYYHDGTLDVRYRESGSFFSFFHRSSHFSAGIPKAKPMANRSLIWKKRPTSPSALVSRAL